MNSIADVSQRLQNALDSNYNVIDMSTVLEVITVLEGTRITKEQLETTRLAKYINQLRRKTSNDQLARRSKNLLKKWREMVIPNQNASSHSQGTKTGGLSKDNVIRRPMPTTPQMPVPNISSSIPMSGAMHSKFPLSIPNSNNGSNSSLNLSHTPIGNNPTINASKVANRTTPVQPTSFANLISQTDANTHIDGSNQMNPIVNSTHRNIIGNDLTGSRSQSPKMPKIPRRNNHTTSGTSAIEDVRSASPLYLMGNRTENFRMSVTNDIDNANSQPPFDRNNEYHQSKLDHSNNARQTFNGFRKMFMSNTTNNSSVSFPCEVNDSHSDSSSMAPASSISLPMTSTTKSAPLDLTDSQKHKKRKRQERKKERDNKRQKDMTATGGAPIFEHSMSNSSSLGMFNSTTNTTTTMTLSGTVPSIHKMTELTFTGKFSKSDDPVINIDTTSGSSSPKHQRGSPGVMEGSPCDSPLLSVENSNESEIVDSLPKSSNDPATVAIPMTKVPLLETLDANKVGVEPLEASMPKKRGRKKGSTGVDRNMSFPGSSASSTGLPYLGLLKTKMELMKSVKKVKTTKELLAELQSKKPTTPLTANSGIASTNSSPMLDLPGQSVVSPSSLCSDNSQTNSTDMRSTTATPVSLQTAPTPEPLAGSDTVPNSDQPKKYQINSKSEQHKTIEDEIEELRSQLPPIDYEAAKNWTDHDDTLICTCKVIEIDPLPAVMNNIDRIVNDEDKVLQIEVKISKSDEQLPKVMFDSSDCIGLQSHQNAQNQPQRKPPIKSIY